MSIIITVLVLLINIILCSAELSTKFQLCLRSDPKINECLKNAIQSALSVLRNGLPEYNIPPIDPMKIPNWSAASSDALNFAQTYSNIELHDHTVGEISEVSANISDTQFTLNMKVSNPETKYEANYQYQNAIIDEIDMSSKGKCTVTSTGSKTDINMTGKIIKKGDVEYLIITDVQVNGTGIDTINFNYETEDAALCETMSQYFNDHWQVIITKEKAKYTAIYAEAYKNEANALFSLIPYNIFFPK